MTRYVRFLLRHRALVTLVVLAVTAASAYLLLTRASIGSSLGKLFLGEMPEYAAYKARVKDFVSDEVVILALADVEALAPDVLDRLEAGVARIRDYEEVGRVSSVLDAERIGFRGGTLRVDSYAAVARDRPEDRAALTEELRTDPFYAGLLLSEDGRHTALVVELVPDEARPAERGPELVSQFVDVLAEAGFARERVHAVGFLAVLSGAMEQTVYSLKTLLPWVAGVLLIVVWLMFRREWPVMLSLGVSVVSVTWTMAFAVLLDPRINILLAMVPAVILIVGLSDVIHLCSAYLIELAHGLDKRAAIEQSAVDVGRACVYTSATTFVGFLGMSFVPTPAFRQLGVVLGFGVAVALLLAVTAVPIVLSWMPRPRPWRVGATSRVQEALDALLRATRHLAVGRPRAVIAAFAAVLAVAGVGLSRLHVETEFTERFAEDSPVRRDNDWFSEHFARANLVDLFVTTPEREGLFDPATLARLAAFQDAVAAAPGVDRVRSLVDVYARLHAALNEDVPDAGRLPATREAMAQYTLLFEMAGGEGLKRIMDFDRRVALVSVRIADEGMRAAAEQGERLAALAPATLGDAATVEATGIIVLLGRWLDEILWGQGKGLLVTFVLVSLMMSVGLRSARLGLWSMVPNALPLLVLGGYLGLTMDHVDSDTLGLAMLAIGIGVDDTIHFLMRYRTEALRAPTRRDAIVRTFDFAGRAIVMTTVVLALGFAPFATHEYYSTRIMGTLLPMTLVVALAADVLLVPAMVEVGWLAVDRPAPREG